MYIYIYINICVYISIYKMNTCRGSRWATMASASSGLKVPHPTQEAASAATSSLDMPVMAS